MPASFLAFINRHSKFLICGVIGLLVLGLSLLQQDGMMSVMWAWNAAIWLYLFWVFFMLIQSSHIHFKEIILHEDVGSLFDGIIAILAGVVSMILVFSLIQPLSQYYAHNMMAFYAIIFITVVGSWLAITILFMFHYAELFYTSPENQRCFVFLSYAESRYNPNYWDFLYFSFTISTALQTSDVQIMTTSARKVVTLHALFNFFYNVAILGIVINITASQALG